MIWLTWRQWRSQAVTTLGALLIVGVVLVYTGPHLHQLYQNSGIAACRASQGDCGPLVDDFTSHYQWLQALAFLILFIPGLVGAFWGAPLVARELETGTHRLAWTQSVSRTRWLATKVLFLGAASVLTAGAFTLIYAWWASPLDTVNANRLDPGVFDQRGIVPMAYAAFAFALGLAAGVTIRRTLAAMATTLAGFVAVRFIVQYWVRPKLATPVHFTTPASFTEGATSTLLKPNDWLVSSRHIDAAGHTLHIGGEHGEGLRGVCHIPRGDFSRDLLQRCAQRLGIQDVLSVQPASRYWAFQIREAVIFAVLALALAATAFWWTQRRIR